MKLKKLLPFILVVILVLYLVSPAFAQNMAHNAEYNLDGYIDLKKQVGHLCNTGAEMKQTIIGDGIISKTTDAVQVKGKLTVIDKNDWVTSESALRKLTVTSVIELCSPPKHEYTTTMYVPQIDEPQMTEQVINGGFETGDFTGWALTGPEGRHEVVTSYTSSGGTVYEPVEGNFFAVLTAGGLGTGIYNVIRQELTLSAGENLSGYAAFDARDYLPFNDDAAVAIINGGQEILWQQSVSSVGNYGETPWTYWEWTAPADGTYIIELRVRNWLDDGLDSVALFDYITTM